MHTVLLPLADRLLAGLAPLAERCVTIQFNLSPKKLSTGLALGWLTVGKMLSSLIPLDTPLAIWAYNEGTDMAWPSIGVTADFAYCTRVLGSHRDESVSCDRPGIGRACMC